MAEAATGKSVPERIAFYQRLRAQSKVLNSKLIRLLPKEALSAGAQALGLLRNNVLVFASEDETSVLMDHCIHTFRHKGKTVIERYLEESDPESVEEEILLNAMLRARHSIFEIEEVVPGLGVEVHDLLWGFRGFIMDLAFGSSAQKNALLVSRLMTPTTEFSMTTGAALPCYGEPGKTILKALETKWFQAGRSINHFTQNELDELSTFITRTLLSAGASEYIRYEDPGSSNVRQVSGLKSVGRNDPCPCGSGRKYKKCCGL